MFHVLILHANPAVMCVTLRALQVRTLSSWNDGPRPQQVREECENISLKFGRKFMTKCETDYF